MTTEAVIFDLDGVIVSTDNYHYLAWKKIADAEGIYFDREINEALRGVSRMESLDIILRKTSKIYTDEQKQELAYRKNEYYKTLLQNLNSEDILTGIMTVLEKLKKNQIKIAIGSSSKNTSLILRQIGLHNYFHGIADGNEIKNSKPHPEVFLLAAKKLGVKPEKCLVVEDADAGIDAAIAARMEVLGVGYASKNIKAHYRAEDISEKLFDKILSIDFS